MHLYFMSRGVKHARDLFVTVLQSQFFPWTRTNLETNEDETTMVQGALRPVELWEYVFPEESLPDVLAMLELNIREEGSYGLSTTTEAMIRRMLKCNKLPKMPEAIKNRIIPLQGMGIHPIGIKKDPRGEMEDVVGNKTWNQEML